MPGAALVPFVAPPVVGPTPGAGAPEGPAVRPEARRTARTPGSLPPLLPVEQVDEIVVLEPERCRHCGQPFPGTATGRRGRAWRHQVVELLPLAVQVTEYQMIVRRCAQCGKRTRGALPDGVPRRPFGARLTAVIALLSGLKASAVTVVDGGVRRGRPECNPQLPGGVNAY